MASAGEAVGGGTDAHEESIGAIQRQRAVHQGLEDAVERAQDGVAIRKGTETDGGTPVPHQRPLAAAGTLFEVMVIRAVGKTGACEFAAGGPVGLDGGAELGFHSILLCEGGVPAAASVLRVLPLCAKKSQSIQKRHVKSGLVWFESGLSLD